MRKAATPFSAALLLVFALAFVFGQGAQHGVPFPHLQEWRNGADVPGREDGVPSRKRPILSDRSLGWARTANAFRAPLVAQTQETARPFIPAGDKGVFRGLVDHEVCKPEVVYSASPRSPPAA